MVITKTEVGITKTEVADFFLLDEYKSLTIYLNGTIVDYFRWWFIQSKDDFINNLALPLWNQSRKTKEKQNITKNKQTNKQKPLIKLSFNSTCRVIDWCKYQVEIRFNQNRIKCGKRHYCQYFWTSVVLLSLITSLGRRLEICHGSYK